MSAHKVVVVIDQSRRAVIQVPDDFPVGEAEILVVPMSEGGQRAREMASWLDGWIASLPPGPGLPLDSTRRESIYP